MIRLKAPPRISDKWGQGHFKAPRGKRLHKGIDFACYPESEILAPVTGVITKLGYPYGDDLSFRYVEIKAANDLYVRVFYVEPLVKVGDKVRKNERVIGMSQKLGDRYKGITEHVHLEIKNSKGQYSDPMGVILS